MSRRGRRFRLPPFILMSEHQRRLPHFHPDNTYIFLTWRLWGSLPRLTKSDPRQTPGQAFAAQDRELDRRTSGPMWLGNPEIASLVAETILAAERERHFYQLYGWVVMPNHVHLLILPTASISVIMRWLKGSTARNANRIPGPAVTPDDCIYRRKSSVGRTGLL